MSEGIEALKRINEAFKGKLIINFSKESSIIQKELERLKEIDKTCVILFDPKYDKGYMRERLQAIDKLKKLVGKKYE